jgi:hypothetical protein
VELFVSTTLILELSAVMTPTNQVLLFICLSSSPSPQLDERESASCVSQTLET